MPDAIRVVDYGKVEAAALGVTFDGVTDDYAAMQRAVERLDKGVELIMGQGTMLLSASIECIDLPGITVSGAGAGQALNLDYGTRIRPQGNFPAFKVGDTSGITVNKNPVHVTLRDFQIYGTSTGTSQHGIVIAATEAASYQAAFNVVERVLIWNMGGDGIRFTDNAWTNTISDCQILSCDGHGINAMDESNTNLIIGCKSSNNGGDGLHLEGDIGRGIYGFDIISLEANANVGYGINVANGVCRGVNIIAYCENNLTGQLNNAGNSTTVTGGRWFQQASAVDEANVDIITWSGKDGGMWGGWLSGECRYAINIANSTRPTFLGVGIRDTTPSVSYYNTDSAADYIIHSENNRLTVPNLLAKGASAPKFSAIDTTNDLEVVMQAGDTEALIGTATAHGFYFATNNVRRITFASGGDMTFADGLDIATNTNIGTMLATATDQKLGFWGHAPQAQKILATGGGATADDIIAFLQSIGLCKQS
jgi:hypothetical protein